MRLRVISLLYISIMGSILLMGFLFATNRFMHVLNTGNSGSVLVPPVAYAAETSGVPTTAATLTLSYTPNRILPDTPVVFTITTSYFTDSHKVTFSLEPKKEIDVSLSTLPGNVGKTGNVTHTYKTAGTYTATAMLWYTNTNKVVASETVTFPVTTVPVTKVLYLPAVSIPQKPTKITAQALPRIPANGKSTYNVTAQLFDQGGQSLPDHPVTVVATGIGYNETQKDMTDAQGRITTTLRAPLVKTSIAPIPVTVQVTAGVISTTLSGYAYPPTKITWASDKMEILANGADTTTIKATVFDDAGVPVSSYPVRFQVGGGLVSPTEGETNADGILASVVQPRTRPGDMMAYAWAGVLPSEQFNLTFKTAPCDDDETRNNSVFNFEPPPLGWQGSSAIWSNGQCIGSLEASTGNVGDSDYYSIHFGAGDTIESKLPEYTLGMGYDIYLYPPEARTTRGVTPVAGSNPNLTNKEFAYTIPAEKPGTYYLRVYKTRGPVAPGTYTLDVVIQRANP